MNARRNTILGSFAGLAIGAALVGAIAAAPVTTDPEVSAAPVVNTSTPTPESSAPATATPTLETPSGEETVTTPEPSSNWTPPTQPVTPVTVDPTPTPEPTTGLPPQTRVCAPWMEPGWIGADGQAMSCIWGMPNTGGELQLKACAEEDSENCYWDATTRGNGQGQSFINIRGHIFYEDGK